MKTLFFLSLILLPTIAMAQSVQQNVVVVFDDSGSMNEYLPGTDIIKMNAAKESLAKVLKNLPANTNVGIITLNGTWEEEGWFLPFGPVNKQTIEQTIGLLESDGGTPLGGCIKAGCDVLLSKRAKQRHGIYRLLIVTDGEANDQSLVEEYTPDIMTRGITVDAIGVGMSGEHTLATKVSNYRRADDPNELTVALQATFAEVSYTDKASADEDFKMLASIPDVLSTNVIQALMDSGNQPIGEVPTIVVDETSGHVTVETPKPASGGAVIFGIVIGCVIGFIFILIVFKALLE